MRRPPVARSKRCTSVGDLADVGVGGQVRPADHLLDQPRHVRAAGERRRRRELRGRQFVAADAPAHLAVRRLPADEGGLELQTRSDQLGGHVEVLPAGQDAPRSARPVGFVVAERARPQHRADQRGGTAPCAAATGG